MRKSIFLTLLFTLLFLTESCQRSHLNFTRIKAKDPEKAERSHPVNSAAQILSSVKSDSFPEQADSISQKPGINPQIKSFVKQLPLIKKKVYLHVQDTAKSKPDERERKYDKKAIVAFASFLIAISTLTCLFLALISAEIFWVILFMGLFFALYFGIIALRDIRKNPSLKGKWLASIAAFGTTLIIVLFVLLLIAAMIAWGGE